MKNNWERICIDENFYSPGLDFRRIIFCCFPYCFRFAFFGLRRILGSCKRSGFYRVCGYQASKAQYLGLEIPPPPIMYMQVVSYAYWGVLLFSLIWATYRSFGKKIKYSRWCLRSKSAFYHNSDRHYKCLQVWRSVCNLCLSRNPDNERRHNTW